MENKPYYPEPFFTELYKEQVYDDSFYKRPNNNANIGLGSLFNNISIDDISKFLPLIMGMKNKKNFNILDMVKDINPDAQKIMALFSTLTSSKKENIAIAKTNSQETKDLDVIDISDYEETK